MVSEKEPKATSTPKDKRKQLKPEDLFVDPKPIASGNFGVVYSGKYAGDPVAIKQIKLPDDPDQAFKTMKQFQDEIAFTAYFVN